jgi:Na+-transporting NADH:ubiquinone oxidoreductase subunit NqrD
MLVCAAAAYFIYKFNGLLILLAPCALVFLIALIMFIVYIRKLHQSKKMTKAIKARLRVKGKM